LLTEIEPGPNTDRDATLRLLADTRTSKH